MLRSNNQPPSNPPKNSNAREISVRRENSPTHLRTPSNYFQNNSNALQTGPQKFSQINQDWFGLTAKNSTHFKIYSSSKKTKLIFFGFELYIFIQHYDIVPLQESKLDNIFFQ
jgi:hypothetical protein